ncbi:MAG: dTDP-glucose 4,6-dehydratase [Acidobacteria bacterium]|nr:dTDP-glucose 4,6-dehydratase [Acidobacteriota bacterium]MBI3425514.1 dTDP-glucose 4,6-dehydratase [Acidobacteriota bacterium]
MVTGGAGFIGTNFVHYVLAQTNAQLVIVDKLTYAGNKANLGAVLDDPRVTFIEADIADRAAMSQVFAEHQPTAVINFAAESHVDRSIDDPSPFIETNITGTFVLLETARKYVRGLDTAQQAAFRFLHVSTDEVYGTLGDTGLFAETTPYAPNSPYAASKACADHLVRAWHETFGLPTIITNCSNNYGPYQFPEKLIPLMLTNALEGKPLPIYGDGGNIRDWLYVEDHCSGILLALQRGVSGEKYNIGGGNERTNLQIVERLCAEVEKVLPAAENAALQAQGKTSYLELKTFVADRPGHDKRYAIDAGKIRAELGWQPKYDFESGLAKTVRWYFDNRDWCETVLAGKYERQRLGAA